MSVSPTPPSDRARDDLVARLRAAGCVFAEDEAALLLEQASSASELDQMAARREAGEPLEHLLGWAEFHGLRILVGPGVFVPRRRTAHLVDLAVRLLAGRAGPVVVDLCCGSGAIGAAIAEAVPTAQVHAADLDPAAVASARRNLEPRGASVHEGDLYDALPRALRREVDLLAVNAPYVPTAAVATMPPEARDHEARLALDGGSDGLDVHRRVARGAPEWLRPGGHLLIETSVAQAPVAADIFERHGLLATVEHCADLEATVVVGVRRGG